MTDKAQHTPGPWGISTETRSDEICTIHGVESQPTSDGLGQGWVYIHYQKVINDEWHWANEAEKMANARLIAAAPELLEALEAIAADPTKVAHIMDCIGRAAIAKARGEA